jgi:hypothetical protein
MGYHLNENKRALLCAGNPFRCASNSSNRIDNQNDTQKKEDRRKAKLMKSLFRKSLNMRLKIGKLTQGKKRCLLKKIS